MSIFYDIVEVEARLQRYGIGRGRLCYLVSDDEWKELEAHLQEMAPHPGIERKAHAITILGLEVRKRAAHGGGPTTPLPDESGQAR